MCCCTSNSRWFWENCVMTLWNAHHQLLFSIMIIILKILRRRYCYKYYTYSNTRWLVPKWWYNHVEENLQLTPEWPAIWWVLMAIYLQFQIEWETGESAFILNKEYNYVWCLNIRLNLQWYLNDLLHEIDLFLSQKFIWCNLVSNFKGNNAVWRRK